MIQSVGGQEGRTEAVRIDRMLPQRTWRTVAAEYALTKRELQVAKGLFRGASEPEIAEELGISRHTTHTYVSRIYRKAGVRTRCNLLIRVFYHHLEGVGDATGRGVGS